MKAIKKVKTNRGHEVFFIYLNKNETSMIINYHTRA